MRSGILIGTCAWLLGAAAATAGSLYAVNDLGQGLITQHSKQVTVAMVNAELALERSAHSSHTPAAPSPSASPSVSPSVHQNSGSPSPSPSAPPDPGELLISKDGTVVAACKPAGAYLVSWSPQQGFAADHVVRGPSQVAKVSFVSSSGGLILGVTCGSGQPVEHIWPLKWGHHDT